MKAAHNAGPFQAAHETLIDRLEREGKAEEIAALRAQRDELAAALSRINAQLLDIATTSDWPAKSRYNFVDALNTCGSKARECREIARAALAKVGGGK